MTTTPASCSATAGLGVARGVGVAGRPPIQACSSLTDAPLSTTGTEPCGLLAHPDSTASIAIATNHLFTSHPCISRTLKNYLHWQYVVLNSQNAHLEHLNCASSAVLPHLACLAYVFIRSAIPAIHAPSPSPTRPAESRKRLPAVAHCHEYMATVPRSDNGLRSLVRFVHPPKLGRYFLAAAS